MSEKQVAHYALGLVTNRHGHVSDSDAFIQINPRDDGSAEGEISIICGGDAQRHSLLITAAPDLKAFAQSFDVYMRFYHGTPDSPALKPQARDMWLACRAALAKAGEC